MLSDLPTLSEGRWLRLVTLAVLYSAQGLPFGLFSVAIPTWMASNGYAAAEIGTFIGITSLPWSLKILAAPMMDRFGYPTMGQRRPWVLGAQFCLLVAFVGFFFVPEELVLMAALGCLANTFAASQDVAVDGMAIGVLPENERATANGFMFGGQYLGISLGVSGGGYLLNSVGLVGVGYVGVGMMSVVLLFPLLLRERPGEKLLPWSSGESGLPKTQKAHGFVALLVDLFRQLVVPVSLLLVGVQLGYRIADGALYAMLPVHTVQALGWADTTYNDWYTFGSILSAVLGVLLAPFVDRVGTGRAFWVIGSFKLVLLLLGSFVIDGSERVVQAYLVANLFSSQLLAICVIATIMRICTGGALATQFAAYMAISNLAQSSGAFWYAALVDSFTSSQMLWLFALCMAMCFPFWYFAFARHLDAADQ